MGDFRLDQLIFTENMSSEEEPKVGEEEGADLLDYEEEPIAEEKEATEAKKDVRGSYAGIHSSGFRDFLLKTELLRAVTDCGFEHPSEGNNFLPLITYLHLAGGVAWSCCRCVPRCTPFTWRLRLLKAKHTAQQQHRFADGVLKSPSKKKFFLHRNRKKQA